MADKKFDFEAWAKRGAERIGVPLEDFKKAFSKEAEAGIDDVLEVPDIWQATYRYSYGGASRFFREIRDNKKLLGSRCPECKKVYCPPRKHCPHCYQETAWVDLPGTGEVVTFTTVQMGTSAFRRYPFVCAYVKVDGTDSVLCVNLEMEDVKRAEVGMKVKAVFKDQRDGRITDFVFMPVEEVT